MNNTELKVCYNLLLEFRNNYLTEQKFAEHLNTSILHVKEILREGRRVQAVIDAIWELTEEIENPRTKPWLKDAIRSHISHGAGCKHEINYVNAAIEIYFGSK